MPDNKDKLTGVTFGKDASAERIAAAIGEMQDAWAKIYPERAHKLYPNVYDERGNRIKKDYDEE